MRPDPFFAREREFRDKMASMIGALGTSPCSPSSEKAGVSSTSRRMIQPASQVSINNTASAATINQRHNFCRASSSLLCRVSCLAACTAGATAAAVLARAGKTVVVLEKTGSFGGSTARSGGGIWAPGNTVLRRAGVADTPEQASAYLAHVTDGHVPEERRQALLKRAEDELLYFPADFRGAVNREPDPVKVRAMLASV